MGVSWASSLSRRSRSVADRKPGLGGAFFYFSAGGAPFCPGQTGRPPTRWQTGYAVSFPSPVRSGIVRKQLRRLQCVVP